LPILISTPYNIHLASEQTLKEFRLLRIG